MIKNRINTATIDPLETEAIKAVTGEEAPSYTSGVQIWNGTAASLNPMPVMINAIPPFSISDGEPGPEFQSDEKAMVPDTTYTNAIPISMKAVESAARIRYFNPASMARARVR